MPQNPLEASFFDARLGNQSVFILDRRLSKLIVPIFLLFESWYLMHFLKKKNKKNCIKKRAWDQDWNPNDNDIFKA